MVSVSFWHKQFSLLPIRLIFQVFYSTVFTRFILLYVMFFSPLYKVFSQVFSYQLFSPVYKIPSVLFPSLQTFLPIFFSLLISLELRLSPRPPSPPLPSFLPNQRELGAGGGRRVDRKGKGLREGKNKKNDWGMIVCLGRIGDGSPVSERLMDRKMGRTGMNEKEIRIDEER